MAKGIKVKNETRPYIKGKDMAVMRTKGLTLTTAKGLKTAGGILGNAAVTGVAAEVDIKKEAAAAKGAAREVSGLILKTKPLLRAIRVKAEKKIFPNAQGAKLKTRTAFSPLLSRRQAYACAYKDSMKGMRKAYLNRYVAKLKTRAAKNAAIRSIQSQVNKIAEKKAAQAAVRFVRRIVAAIKAAVTAIVAASGFIVAVPVLAAVLIIATFPSFYNSLTPAGTGMFVSPFGDTPYTITSPYGIRLDPFTGEETFHGGWDVCSVTGEGSPIFSVCDGTVSAAFTNDDKAGYGYFVIIKPDIGENMSIMYAHLYDVIATPGQEVTAGQLIGMEGNTGRSTGTHLHFEVRIENEPVDGSVFWDLIPEAENSAEYLIGG